MMVWFGVMVEFEPCSSEVYSIQHYVIMFVSGLWFSPATPVSSTNNTDRHNITGILLKVTLNTIKPNQTIIQDNVWFFKQQNIPVILWRSVLLVEETGVAGENHRPLTNMIT
jgi:hypothetical protein